MKAFIFTLLISILFQWPLLAKAYDLQDFKKQAVGTYGHYDIVAYEERFLIFGKMKTYVITYGITEFKLEDGKLVESDRFCHAEHVSNLPIKSRVPDSFTRAIVPRTTPVVVTAGSVDFAIFRPSTPTAIGIQLNPEEELPLDPKDPRIIDSDDDGKPGVTVYIEAGPPVNNAELYIARREIFAYQMEKDNAGGFKGYVIDNSEQLIVGSNTILLRGQRNPKQHENPNLSPIYLVPVAADTDCESLMEMREELFPPNPEIW